jgi:hypothetical protein
MNHTALIENRGSWTWADLLSTYRYWGLFLAFVLATAAMQLQYSYVYSQFRGLGYASIGSLTGFTRFFWPLFALPLAWVAIRTKPVSVMLGCGVLAALASLTPLFPWIPAKVALVAVLFCIPLFSSLMILLLPASIAGARVGSQTMLVAFGAPWAFCMLFIMAAIPVGGWLVEQFSFRFVSWSVFALLLIAIVALSPIKGKLFTLDPPDRGYSFAPVERDPVLTTVLSMFVPFYALYWIYRIHGEEAYLKPSRQLLSPRAAAWITVIPVLGALLLPFMLSQLADRHNETAADFGIARMQRPWAVFLWTLLCAAVAIGLLQSKFNELVSLRAKGGLLPEA